MENLYSAKSKWMEGTGPDNDVVVSSRIRLARNIDSIPFPHFMEANDAGKVVEAVKAAVNKNNVSKELGKSKFVNLAEIDKIDRQILVEKHLVSPQHVDHPENRAVVVNENESVSIMINEEDHLRIQCLLPGLQLEDAWIRAEKIDDLLEETLNYSYSEKLGYLTSCPTNVGTGLRASVMLHLPFLVMAKQINQIVNIISQLGLAVRGYYGEGTEAYGNLFQVSNQVTLGQTEEEIVKNLLSVTKQVVAQEKATRDAIFSEKRHLIEDRIFRAIGTMRFARVISSQEALNNISDMRLGLELGILADLNFEMINELIVLTRPAFMIKKAGRSLNARERDIMRAEIIREKLKEIKIG